MTDPSSRSENAGRRRGPRILAGAIRFGLAYGAATALALVGDVLVMGRMFDPRMVYVLALFTIAATLAAAFAWAFAGRFRPRRPSARLALMLILLMLGTPALAAFLTFVDLYSRLTEWFSPLFSVGWGYEFVFTGATAAYIFAVVGARMFLPFGLIPLLIGGLVFARHAAPRDGL